MPTKICVRLALFLLLCPLLTGAATESSESGKAGFVDLFDGKTLEGWKAYRESGEEVPLPESAWSVQDGLLYCSGKRGVDYWLVPRKEYGDCVLRLEYKLPEKTNSGVFMRVPGVDMPAWKGFEVQIVQDHGEEPSLHGSGAIYDVLCPMRNMCKPAGEWNEMEVTMKGLHVKVVLNGFKVIDADFAELVDPIGKFSIAYADFAPKGRIGVQNHGYELWFRKIQVKGLD